METFRLQSIFRILVTGSQGKVGKHVVRKAKEQGHFTIGVDLARGEFDTYERNSPWPEKYIQCDLTDAGAIYSAISIFKPDAVIHVAAIPDPSHSPPHVVFTNNINSTFNVVEACVRLGVKRLVNVSSETVPGFHFQERVIPGSSGIPLYCPIDELHPVRPQDPYALSKYFGEQLCDAAVRRCPEITIISIRPSWCQDETNIARNLGPLIRDKTAYQPGPMAYIIITDLAEAMIAAAVKEDGIVPNTHEVVYIAAEDSIGNRDLKASVEAYFGAGVVEMRPINRFDASGINCKKANTLLNWRATKTWRDFLTENGEKRC
jgi:UDP-glucose 4-epimerase